MDKQRFTLFRRDLAVIINNMIQRGYDVDQFFNPLVSTHPELNSGSELPDLVPREGRNKCSTQAAKNIEDIKQKLNVSVQNGTRFQDYAGFKVNLDNQEICLQTLKTLEVTEADAKKRIIYFSCLEGQVLNSIRKSLGRICRGYWS